MIKKLRVAPETNTLKQRLTRRWVFYGAVGVFAVAATLFLLITLRSLFLPVLFGAILSYIFRPMKNFMRVSWLPDHLRITMLFSGVLLALFWASVGIKSLVPGDRGAIELKIRMQYKFNQKLEEILDVNAVTGEGDSLYEMLGTEIKPMVTHVNELLSLSPGERKEFIKYVNHVNPSERPALPYVLYFTSNERFFRQKNEISDPRSPASVAGSEFNGDSADKQKKGAALGGLLAALSTWFVMPLVFIFLMFDDGQILRFVLRLIPNRYFEVSMMVVKEFDRAVGSYLRGTLLECLLVGLTIGVGLFIVGASFTVALAVGFVAAVTNVIPFLGHFFGLIVGLGYALIAENVHPLLPFIGPEDLFVAVIAVVGITHVLDNVIYQPVVIGGAVNLHPLVVVLAVVGGSLAFGFAGMLLAVPAIVIIKTVVETLFKELKAYRII
jgi:predicted PurR-regulated permease PerM